MDLKAMGKIGIVLQIIRIRSAMSFSNPYLDIVKIWSYNPQC